MGRQAHLKGTRLAAWQVVLLARSCSGDGARTAEYLDIPLAMVSAALRYAQAYPEEIEAAIADNEKTPEELARLIPHLEVIDVDADAF